MPVEINEQMSFPFWHNFMSTMPPRILDRCKTGGERGARGRKRKQAKDRLRHDPEHSFGANEKSDKIEPGFVLMGSTADSNNCSVSQDDLETKNIVAGYTVLQAAWTACIGRNISADRAVLQTCGIRGIKKAAKSGLELQFAGNDARFDHCNAVCDSNLFYPIHSDESNRYASMLWNASSHIAVSCSARGDRNLSLIGKAEQSRHLFGRPWLDDNVGKMTCKPFVAPFRLQASSLS